MRRVAAELASVDPRTLPAPTLEAAVVELRAAIDGLEGVWSRFVAALDGSGAVEGGTTAWLRSACRLSPATARTQVTLARRLGDRPETAAALSAGEISTDHARLLTTALAELAAVDDALALEAETPLVAAARQVDPTRLRREIAHARYALVPEATAEADALAYQRRHLDVATTFDGTVSVHGVLDPESGDILRTALNTLSGRTGPDDRRSPGHCRADALVELCHRQLDHGHLPAVGGERPHLTVLVPLPALTAGHAAATAIGPRSPMTTVDADSPADVVSAADVVSVAGTLAAETIWGAVLGPESTRRLACDASITRVVLGPDSQPLDVGRRTRLIPPAIRTALTVRDRGCTYPGCDRGPQWTDAHHIRHWTDGGPTSLDNLTLLCRQHHRAIHERDPATPHAPPRAAA